MNRNPNDPAIAEILRRLRDLETTAPGGSTAVSRGRTRFVGNESLLVQGSGKVEGWWVVTGTQRVAGRLEGDGTLDWTGPWYLRGVGFITGNTTLDGNLSVGSGRIQVGPLILDRLGPAGGRIRSTGQLVLGDGTGSVYVDGSTSVQGPLSCTGNFFASGDVGGGSKSFWIDHPTKPGKQLRHGSLEGPEHGVYYRGVVTFDSDGEAVFELPDYFTALVLPDDVPTVQVTGVGRPFLVGAEPVADGRVTVYGTPGRDAHVTVTAARANFEVEPDKVQEGPQ